jgi:hypothetical protein
VSDTWSLLLSQGPGSAISWNSVCGARDTKHVDNVLFDTVILYYCKSTLTGSFYVVLPNVSLVC